MTLDRVGFLTVQSVKNLFSGRGLTELLSAFGAMWLVVEIADWFDKNSRFSTWVHTHWIVLLFAGCAYTIWRCRPQVRIAVKLNRRDVRITLAIGDIFSFDGALVIGSNSTFDVSHRVISPKSVQGQFTSRYYTGDEQLEAELEQQLRDLPCEDLDGKRLGKCKRYPIGSVVRLVPRGRIGYLLAISDINEHGTSHGSFEKLKQSLAELWVFIGQRGTKEPLVMPVLGSGFTRLTQPRQQIVQEIITSFVAACSEKSFCEDLTIVLSEKDVTDKQIDFRSLGDYLRYVCLYEQFSDREAEQVGTAEA